MGLFFWLIAGQNTRIRDGLVGEVEGLLKKKSGQLSGGMEMKLMIAACRILGSGRVLLVRQR